MKKPADGDAGGGVVADAFTALLMAQIGLRRPPPPPPAERLLGGVGLRRGGRGEVDAACVWALQPDACGGPLPSDALYGLSPARGGADDLLLFDCNLARCFEDLSGLEGGGGGLAGACGPGGPLGRLGGVGDDAPDALASLFGGELGVGGGQLGACGGARGEPCDAPFSDEDALLLPRLSREGTPASAWFLDEPLSRAAVEQQLQQPVQPPLFAAPPSPRPAQAPATDAPRGPAACESAECADYLADDEPEAPPAALVPDREPSGARAAAQELVQPPLGDLSPGVSGAASADASGPQGARSPSTANGEEGPGAAGGSPFGAGGRPQAGLAPAQGAPSDPFAFDEPEAAPPVRAGGAGLVAFAPRAHEQEAAAGAAPEHDDFFYAQAPLHGEDAAAAAAFGVGAISLLRSTSAPPRERAVPAAASPAGGARKRRSPDAPPAPAPARRSASDAAPGHAAKAARRGGGGGEDGGGDGDVTTALRREQPTPPPALLLPSQPPPGAPPPPPPPQPSARLLAPLLAPGRLSVTSSALNEGERAAVEAAMQPSQPATAGKRAKPEAPPSPSSSRKSRNMHWRRRAAAERVTGAGARGGRRARGRGSPAAGSAALSAADSPSATERGDTWGAASSRAVRGAPDAAALPQPPPFFDALHMPPPPPPPPGLWLPPQSAQAAALDPFLDPFLGALPPSDGAEGDDAPMPDAAPADDVAAPHAVPAGAGAAADVAVPESDDGRLRHVVAAAECAGGGFYVQVSFAAVPARTERLPQRFADEADAARAADALVRRRLSAPLNFPTPDEAAEAAAEALLRGVDLAREPAALSDDDVAAMVDSLC
jgi:hypothetical protein